MKRFICPYCGNQLDPRKFETAEGIRYAIFDHCFPEPYIFHRHLNTEEAEKAFMHELLRKEESQCQE